MQTHSQFTLYTTQVVSVHSDILYIFCGIAAIVDPAQVQTSHLNIIDLPRDILSPAESNLWT